MDDAAARAGIAARLRAAGCVFAEDEAALLLSEGVAADELERRVQQRIDGVPLEQVVGWAEFCDQRILLDRGVFVPRRRSALLVRVAAGHDPQLAVDLCCGSGALAVALAAAVPGCSVHAADVDPAAVRCARRNLAPDHVHQGDLYAALPGDLAGRIDVVLANAPYVPSAEIALMPREAREHEPTVALDGGADGIALHRRILLDAAGWLAPRGVVLLETSPRHAAVELEACSAAGLLGRFVRDDALDATVLVARRG